MCSPSSEVVMRFLLLLHGTESTEAELSADERRRIVDEHLTFGRELRDTGRLVIGEALGSSSEAKVVRDGAVVDGPFAETKEQLGGFYVVDAPTLDDAIDVARRVPRSPGLAGGGGQGGEMDGPKTHRPPRRGGCPGGRPRRDE